jgi:hypothetical protein
MAGYIGRHSSANSANEASAAGDGRGFVDPAELVGDLLSVLHRRGAQGCCARDAKRKSAQSRRAPSCGWRRAGPSSQAQHTMSSLAIPRLRSSVSILIHCFAAFQPATLRCKTSDHALIQESAQSPKRQRWGSRRSRTDGQRLWRLPRCRAADRSASAA